MFDDAFDREKSTWTKTTRGIDFVEVRQIWKDPDAIMGPATDKNGEVRWLKIGRAYEKIWTAGFTFRNEKIRIFMVRASRPDEKEVYFGS